MVMEIDNNTKINEMNITDEFSMVGLQEKGMKIAQELQNLGDAGVVLVTKGSNEVVGYIREKEITSAVAGGDNPSDTFASNLMNKDFMEILEHETLGNLIPKLSDRYPNAIVVTNNDGNCVGYFSKNDYQEALAGLGCYDRSREPEYKTPDEWRIQGIAMVSTWQLAEAVQCFAKVVEYCENQERGWFELARGFELTNRLKESILCYDQVTYINPENEDAWLNRGNSYSLMRMPDRAIQSYVHALDVDPNNVKALINMGLALSDLGQINKAIAFYNKAAMITGDNAEIWYRKGNAYDKSQELKEAIKCYDIAVQLNTNFEDAWFNKGVALNTIGKVKKAIQCFQQVLMINPNNVNAREAIAVCQGGK